MTFAFRFILRLTLMGIVSLGPGCFLVPLAYASDTDIVINEIMYNPSPDLGSDEDYEYVELFNRGETGVDISGWRLEMGGNVYIFPSGAFVPSDGFLVLCRNPDKISGHYGIGNLYGPYAGALDNGGEDLILLDDSPEPVEIDRVRYSDGPPWPTEPDGDGSSLELCNPGLNNELPESWAASSPSSAYGTPGMLNSTYTENIPPLISFVARTPQAPTSSDQVNITASVFDEDGIRFVHLYYDSGYGFISMEMRDDGNCGDGGAGDAVFGAFISPQDDGTLIKYYIAAQDTTGASSSLPADAPESWYCYRVEDSPVLEGEIVINEIMYNNPFFLDADSEWVELYNTTDHAIDLSCWILRDENDPHSFFFPEGTEIPSHGYLVVCRNLTVFQLQYGEEYPDLLLIGEFDFNLGDGGDAVRIFNANDVLIDIVEYDDRLPWSEVADGVGASLECADPAAENNVFTAWGASLEPHPHGTPGQVNTVYSPGSHDTDIVINEIMYHPLSAEQQEKFIEIVNIGKDEISLNGWQLVGDVSFTFPTTATILPGEHAVIAADYKWLYTQGVAEKLFGSFQGLTSTGGQTVALRNASGVIVDYVDFKDDDPWPILPDGEGPSLELINPYDDNDFGRNWADGSPSSPGRQNDAFSTNNAPYITKADHTPDQPKDSDNLVITARVRDADGLSAVWVAYQVVLPGHYIRIFDSEYQTSWTMVAMNDGGLDGDAEAGDGIYTATLPPQNHRTLVRYIVYARDASAGEKQSRAPRESDPSKNYAYFVYNGVPSYHAQTTYLGQPRTHTVLTKIPVYHLIADDYDVLECEYREIAFWDKVGRHEFRWRGTFVYDGEVYDHIYFRLRGGVHRYHQHKRAYKIKFNRGRRFVMKDNYGNVFPEKRKKLNLNSNIQQVWTGKRGEEGIYEALGYQLFRDVDVRFSYTTWVHFRIIDDESETGADQYKGDFYGIFTEVEQPDDNLLKTHAHPLTGNFYKIDTGAPNGKWEKEVNDIPPLDEADIQAFWNAYHGSPTVQWWRTNFNLESWYSYHAIVDAIHHTDVGAGKNYYYYLNPETGLWEVYPWDLDLTFDVPYGGGQGPFVDRVLGTYPDIFGVEYKNRLREILQLIYTPEHIFPIIDRWRDLIIEMTEADRDRWDQMPLPNPYPFQGQLEQTPWQNLFESLDYRINGLKNWITSRRSTMFGWARDSDIPKKPVNQSPPDGSEAQGIPLLISSSFSDPNGDSHAASRWMLIRQGADWAYPLWDSGEDAMKKTSVVVPSEVLENLEWYEWRVKHLDSTNRWSEWSDATSFRAMIVSDATPPTAPTGLSARTPDYHTVLLSWEAASDPDTGILGYEVSRDGQLLAAGLTELSYGDDALRENTSYQYQVVAVNGGGTKSEAAEIIVTTPQDDVPPGILSVEAITQDRIRIVFNEPLNADSARNPANYRLTDWVSVMSASLQPDGQTVELTTAAMSHGFFYGLTVNNVTDASSAANPIAPDTKVAFRTEFNVEVSDLRLSTGNSVLLGDFAVGSYVYSDSLYYFIGSPIPPELSTGAMQIRLPNDPYEDRYNQSADYLTFNVSFDVEVWVGYRRKSQDETLTLPAWLSDGTWESTGFTQYVDKSGSARYHDFHKKLFYRGEVVLGGNAQPPASGHSNYIAVVRPLDPPDPDLDDDGLPDGWEIDWIGDVSLRPGDDDDGDGRTNFEEFVAGTSPLDSASFFEISALTINDGCLEITWPTASFKYYQVYHSSDLSGEWLPFGGPRDSSSGVHLDSDFPSIRRRYYRVEVW